MICIHIYGVRIEVCTYIVRISSPNWMKHTDKYSTVVGGTGTYIVTETL